MRCIFSCCLFYYTLKHSSFEHYKCYSHLSDRMFPLFMRLVLGLFILCVSSLVLSDSGSIRVSVVDADNKRAVSAAEITTISRDGLLKQALTGADGVAAIDNLAPGLYELSVSVEGYRIVKLPSLRVNIDKATPLRIELSPARSNIEETLVTASQSSVDALSSAGSSFRDREALRSAAGSGSDVLRALDGLPGLFSSGDFASFTVRGAGPQDNLILVDGVPFDNVVHFGNAFGEQEDLEGGGRYSVFAPNIIEGAEFQPGGWNAAYGGRAGSLLKLEVAEGNPDTASYTARLDIAGIEIGYDGPSGLHDDTSVLFSARSLDFGRVFETIGINDLGAPKLTDIILKTKTQIDLQNTLSFLAIYAPEEFTRDIENVLASDDEEPGNFDNVSLERNETDNVLYVLNWTRLIGDSAEWENRFYYRIFDAQSASGEAFPDLSPLGTASDDIFVRENILVSSQEEVEFGLRTDVSVDNALGRFSTGARITSLDLAFDLTLNEDWIRYEYDQNDFRADPDQRFIVLTPEAVNNRFEERVVSYATYIDQVFSFDRWDFRTGLRYDRDGLSDEGNFSPRFAANWQANDTLGFSATAGRFLQSPLFTERATDASNAALKNERIDQISIGLNYLLTTDITFFIEPYYQERTRLVVDQDGVNQTSANTGEGRVFGFDTALTRRFQNGWSANINYSFNRAHVKDKPQDTYYDADFSRPHAFNVGGIWEINERWKLSARWKWASGATSDSFIIYDNVLGDGNILRFSKETSEQNTGRFDSFHSLNFRVDYQKALGRLNVIAFLDVINAYGAANPSASSFNERTGENTINDGDAFPLIGLRLEW